MRTVRVGHCRLRACMCTRERAGCGSRRALVAPHLVTTMAACGVRRLPWRGACLPPPCVWLAELCAARCLTRSGAGPGQPGANPNAHAARAHQVLTRLMWSTMCWLPVAEWNIPGLRTRTHRHWSCGSCCVCLPPSRPITKVPLHPGPSYRLPSIPAHHQGPPASQPITLRHKRGQACLLLSLTWC